MRYRNSALYSAVIAVLASGGLASGSALASGQQTPAPTGQEAQAPAAPQAPQTLETIQVTATKRITPLQKTPVAISAISAETLDKERVMTVQDITKLVPGFQATTQGDHDVITLTLRGVGNDSAKTEYADPEVAIFVDGVYAPRAEAAAGLLLDIESTEVLRGPQGTLWGRNSTVGAVNFQTVKPQIGSFSGSAQMTVGNYNTIGMRAAANLPVNDVFAMRVAVAQEQHDGYVDYQDAASQFPSVADQQAAYDAYVAAGNTPGPFRPLDANQFASGGDKYNMQNQSAARVSALWQPSETFAWNVSVEYFRDRGTPNANLMQRPRAGQDHWSTLADTAPYKERDAYALRSRMDWDINESLRLSYIAGYSDYDGSSTYDQDGGVQVPTSFTTGATFQEDRTNYSNYKSSSHEFNLSSMDEQALDWILGLYYAAEDNNIRFDIPIFNGTRQGTVAWQGSFIQPKQTVDSYAVFGQATWHINDELRLTAGARYTDDTKKNHGGRGWGWAYNPAIPQVPLAPSTIPSPETGFNVSTVNDGKYTNSETTWLVRMDGDIGERGLWYASVSTGYKSGGLQDGGVTYDGETLTNYEVGAKFSFLDGRMTWNSAAYYMDFKDFQLAAPITFPDGNRGLGFSNVEGSTKISGIESELAALIGENDRVNLVMSAIIEKKLGTLRYAGSNDYQGLPPCPPESGISNCMDVSGNELAHAPDFTLTGIWEHDFHLGNGGTLTPRVSAQYQTKSWLSPFNLGEGDQQEAYTRGDISIRYQEPGGKWWAGAYVQNVSDGKVRTNAGRFANGNEFIYLSQYLPPRTFGVNFGLWF